MTSYQASLFSDAAVAAEDEVDSAEDALPDSTRQKKRKKKRPIIPDGAPRIVNEHDLAEADKVCGEHGCALERDGEHTIERLQYTRPSIHVQVDICAKYRCPICAKADTAEPDEPELIDGSAASASLLAHIAVSKFCDALPLCRQETILARSGIDISRTTMATWMMRTAEWLMPLYNLMGDVTREATYRAIDETPIQVHGVDGKKNTSNSFMWVTVAKDGIRSVVVYYFDPTRSAAVARRLLEGCTGWVHTDGYKVYGKVADEQGLRRIGCLMHIRRKFHKAREVAKAAKAGGEIAERALAIIRDIYAVEAEAKGLWPPERKALRDEKTTPLLAALKAHADRHVEPVPKSTSTGEALAYCLVEWEAFIRFMEDGSLEADNGEVERRIKHFAVGRANWSFCDSKAGAEASRILYTVLESAKASGHEPLAYLTEVLQRMPYAHTMAEIEELLPWNLGVPTRQ